MMKGGIAEIFFSAAVVEGNLYNSTGNGGVCKGQMGQPIVHIESVAAACTAAAIAFATAWFTIFCTT
jgi:hypothetical protein